MRSPQSSSVVIFLLSFFCIPAFGQFNLFRPEIVAQTPSPLTTPANTPITISLNNLIVVDADPLPVYPNGFSLIVSDGQHYTVNEATITPRADFVGMLEVPIRVSDGRNTSRRFKLRIEVTGQVNIQPQITGQVALQIGQGQNLTLDLSHLQVTDPDNQYPDDFTLNVFSGNNYTLNGTTITPRVNFSGNLKVPVSVSDGQSESKRFDLKVEVTKAQNVVPIITGQSSLSTTPGTPLSITLNHLTVTDPDNKYPDDFTLKISRGNNYSVDGNTITPTPAFTGELIVKVRVNDGKADSESFDLKVQVNESYQAPQITGQTDLDVKEDEAITLQLNHLKVTGGANAYPKGFSLIISPGANYTFEGMTVIPRANYSGSLSVALKVNDGTKDSAPYNLAITVHPLNDPPVITGQTDISTNKNVSLPINLTHLNVTDPDNAYPAGFSLKVLSGPNYTIVGNTITPGRDFVGVLSVNLRVNDGDADSEIYPLQIDVLPVIQNTPPVITGQKAISIVQNTTLTVHLSHLNVTDPDTKYPTGFSLKVLPGDNYTVEGATIKALPGFSTGTLSVGVIVNDGIDDSQPFDLRIQVVPSTSTPRINGQKELPMPEDSSLVITLSHLEVTDADNLTYPKGFSLIVLPGDGTIYTVQGNTITPAPNLNGFIDVGVKVSDGINTSDEFKLSILVTPVNDAPEILNFSEKPVSYQPGSHPISLFETLDLRDVDNDHLSMAEIGFRADNHSPANDELLSAIDSSNIKRIYDPSGILFLVGYATIADYTAAIHSIQYNYIMTQDENGNPKEISSGPRTVYIHLHDGQTSSKTHELSINMETEVSLDIPNAFTPNGDFTNDTWHIEATNKNQLGDAVIRVYNKRGLLIYESVGLDQEWDGLSNGQLLPVDTYYYTIDLNLPYVKKSYKGAVSILH